MRHHHERERLFPQLFARLQAAVPYVSTALVGLLVLYILLWNAAKVNSCPLALATSKSQSMLRACLQARRRRAVPGAKELPGDHLSPHPNQASH